MSVTTVLVIDDQPLFRQGVRCILEGCIGEFEIVAEGTDGAEGLQLAATREPSVVILNAEVEGLNGLEAIRALKHQVPGAGVIVITSREDEEKLFYAIKYGAAAYLLKSVEPEELISVTRQVAMGHYLINDSVLSKPVVASRVLKSFRDLATEVDQDVEPLFIPLSVREVEVLDYIAKGNSNKEIARAMSISDQTVKNHITSIMRKLAVNDRTQAVVYALRHGWIKA
jgi:DNA-binding NarL/FixJ family response regulator